MHNRVFVLDSNKEPLMPCHPARARQVLRSGKAAVFKRYPFTIILKERDGMSHRHCTIVQQAYGYAYGFGTGLKPLKRGASSQG